MSSKESIVGYFVATGLLVSGVLVIANGTHDESSFFSDPVVWAVPPVGSNPGPCDFAQYHTATVDISATGSKGNPNNQWFSTAPTVSATGSGTYDVVNGGIPVSQSDWDITYSVSGAPEDYCIYS